MSGLTGFTFNGSDLSYLFLKYTSGNNPATGYTVNGRDLSSIFQGYTKDKQSIECGHKITTINPLIYWGNNFAINIGDTSSYTYSPPTVINNYFPKNILNSTNTISQFSIFSIYACSLALDTSGDLFFFGSNEAGQRGDASSNGSQFPGSFDSNSYPPTIINKYFPPGALTPTNKITKISCGFSSCLALDSSGDLFFWGDNYTGQLGSGTGYYYIYHLYYPPTIINGYFPPGVLTPTNKIVDMVTAQWGSLALDTSGNLFFWGDNNLGQIGDASNVGGVASYKKPTIINKYFPQGILSPTNKIIQFGLHDFAAIALDSIGNVFVWGNNQTQQLGTVPAGYYSPILFNSNFPSGVLSPTNKIIQVAIGRLCCLALDSSGDIFFWGNSQNAILGDGIGGPNIPVSTPVIINPYFPSGILTPTNKITKITSLTQSACMAMDTCGNLFCWGKTQQGQFGDNSGNGSTYLRPKIINQYFPNGTINSTTTFAISDYHCIAMTPGTVDYDVKNLFAMNTKKVWFWGNNNYAQLGNDNTNSATAPPSINYYMKPTPITGLTNITNIDIMASAAIALDSNKNVWFWGQNQNAILGNDNTNTTTAPASSNYYMRPTQITDLSNMTAIASSAGGCISLDTSKRVWFWGSNSNGQLGNGNTNTGTAPTTYNYNMKPTRITALTNISAISSNVQGSSIALDSSGFVWFWGYNGLGGMGQLGNGNTNSATPPSTSNFFMAPTKITGLSNITNISNGCYGCLAIDSSKNVWFWGSTGGQLGNGNTNTATAPPTLNYYMTPTKITDLSNITAVSIGINACLAIDSSKNVWFWGRNATGQLGNGNTNTTAAPSTLNYYMTPTQITGLSNITAITINFMNSCLALDASGFVWFWGKNDQGQLGYTNSNSTSTAYTFYNCYMTPTIIPGLNNITNIVQGFYQCLAV